MLVFLSKFVCYYVTISSVSVTSRYRTSYKSVFDYIFFDGIFLDIQSELTVFQCIAWLTIGEYPMTTAADGEYTPRPTVNMNLSLVVELHRFPSRPNTCTIAHSRANIALHNID